MPRQHATNPSASQQALGDIPEDKSATTTTQNLVKGFKKIPCIGIILTLIGECFSVASAFALKKVNMDAMQAFTSSFLIQLLICLPIVLLRRMPVISVTGERIKLTAIVVSYLIAGS